MPIFAKFEIIKNSIFPNGSIFYFSILIDFSAELIAEEIVCIGIFVDY